MQEYEAAVAATPPGVGGPTRRRARLWTLARGGHVDAAASVRLKLRIWRGQTLRFRFALWTAGLLLLALLAFGALVYAILSRGLAAAVDESLQLSAGQALGAVNIENGQLSIEDVVPASGTLAGLRDRGLTIRVLTPTGQVLQAYGLYRDLAAPAPDNAAARGQPGYATYGQGSAAIRWYIVPLVRHERVLAIVEVARSLQSVQAAGDRLLVALLISIPLLVCFVALCGYLLAARALAPIDHITRTARLIGAQDLHARLNLPGTDDEVGRLAATFDSMLERLELSFRRQRQFTADASHELRTPLAAIDLIVGVTRAEPRSAEEYRQALDDLSAQTSRLRALTEDLLQLARNESRQHMAQEQVDLSTLVADVCDSFHGTVAAKGLTLTCAVAAGLRLEGDTDGLIRLFVNLLDNGAKYTQHGGISVRGALRSGAAVIEVSDSGSGIAAADVPRIFDRFYRAEPSRTTGGAGLGLAIALDIARAHGGTIRVQSRPGAGTTLTVILPLTTRPLR